MTFDETLFKIGCETGMEIRTMGQYDLADKSFWHIDCQMITPTGVVVLEFGLSRYHRTERDDEWVCDSTAFVFGSTEINQLINGKKGD